jgi:tetratricopeptide (TPR) repeat protein
VRNDIWKDELSFWLSTVHASPGSSAARNNLGITYARAGNHAMAIGEFKKGLALHDRQGREGAGHDRLQRAKIFNNLGQCYYQLLLQELPADKSLSCVDAPGRDTIKRLFALSLTSYQKALTINPANHELRNNLKDLFYLMKNYPPAEEENQKVSAAHHGRL